MITDSQTNIVYLSDKLRTGSPFAATCKKITEALDSVGVEYRFLPHTKDIWVRDFMPIQINKQTFIEYKYDPDYLQNIEARSSKSYPDFICDAIGLKTKKTDLILDGGNVVKSKNCIILTNKVVDENKDSYTQAELIEKLKSSFEVEKIVLIPWDEEDDFLGHADGMIRFINDETVLLDGYLDTYPKKFVQALYGALKNAGLQWEKMIYDVKAEDDRNWAYLNFLQTKDVILVPQLGIPEDAQALEQIRAYFPEYTQKQIVQIEATVLVEEGGAFNCIAWPVQE